MALSKYRIRERENSKINQLLIFAYHDKRIAKLKQLKRLRLTHHSDVRMAGLLQSRNY